MHHEEIIDESESHLRFLLCLGSTIHIHQGDPFPCPGNKSALALARPVNKVEGGLTQPFAGPNCGSGSSSRKMFTTFTLRLIWANVFLVYRFRLLCDSGLCYLGFTENSAGHICWLDPFRVTLRGHRIACASPTDSPWRSGYGLHLSDEWRVEAGLDLRCEACEVVAGCYLFILLMSQSMSEWMFRPMLVMLYKCSLATSQTISQIWRSE
jgi:hypothetical protein